MDERLSEVVGAFLGDGCISTYREGKRTRTVVLFTGNWRNDREYYEAFIVPTIRERFGGMRRPYHRKDDNSLRYALCDRKIVAFFIGLGLPIGMKGRRLRIPEEIIQNDAFLKACIRGIFGTDGSVYRRYSKRYRNHAKPYTKYAVIQFKMEGTEVIESIRECLCSNGICVNRTIRTGNCSVIRVTRQESVRKFAEIVGFSHSYHRKRYSEIVG